MKDRHKFALFFVTLIVLYVWLRAREDTHISIKSGYTQIASFSTLPNDDENDNAVRRTQIEMLLGALHSQSDWITVRVFAISVFILVAIQIFGFIVNLLSFDIETARRLFTPDSNNTNNTSNTSTADALVSKDGIANAVRTAGRNMGSQLSGLHRKLMDPNDRTITHIFVNPETVKQVGAEEILEVVYTFAMSVKFMVLSFVLIYVFNYSYAYLVVQQEDHLDEEGLHMHADIMLFMTLMILLYLLFYMSA